MKDKYWVKLASDLAYVDKGTGTEGTLEQCLDFMRNMNLYAWDTFCQGWGTGEAFFEHNIEEQYL